MYRDTVRGIIIATFFLISCSGCATLSKESCQKGDWYGIGYKDGADGRPHSRLVDHEKACLEYNVSPNKLVYRQGWDDGVKIFCTEQKGYEEGEDLDEYEGVCPAELEQGFLKGYLLGLDSAENDLRQEISTKNREVIKASVSLQELEGKAHKKLKEKIDRLEREIESAEDDISDIYDLRRQYSLKIKTP